MTVPTESESAGYVPNGKWKIQVIPRIDLGHILTIVGMVSVLVVSYNSFDKRVVILEEAHKTGQARTVEKESQWKDSVLDLKGDVKELQRSVNEINRNIRPVTVDRK